MTIDLDLSADQRQIVQSIDDVLADRFPLARFRGARGGGCDAAALGEVAALGWMGLAVDERHGGAGLSVVEDVLLFRTLGRHLVTPSVMAGALAAQLALAVGDDAFAAGIVQGRVRVCLGNRLGGATAESGLALYDSAAADVCLCWDSAGIAAVPIGQLGTLAPGQCIDRTIALRRAAAAPAGSLMLAGDAAHALRRRADLLLAAQLLGAAEAALALAVDYAKLRQQFGQPIGAFQAIKHRCADMKLRTKLLGALVLMAALAEHEGRSEAAAQIVAARLLAARYALDNAAAGIQIHGAMGFTAECDAHLFLLRAHLLENVGSTAREREVEMATVPLGLATNLENR